MNYPEEPRELLSWVMSTYGESFAISTSFQSEGMVLVDMAARINPKVRVFTLDTGRLPEETYQMMEVVRERYGMRVETVFPDHSEVERMTRIHGVNLFYREVALRKLCCEIRKVRPMGRHLATVRAWATGLRRSQSEERANVPLAEEVDGRLKLSPLAAWSAEQVEGYLLENKVPRHALHAKGYPSIGCAPCTRAIQAGEQERSGRWWWEQDGSKECGLHVTPTGQVKRTLDVLLADILKN